MVAAKNGTDCVADLFGSYGCTCADCVASAEAEAESEFLAEVGASYAYSGFSASDAMQQAREDLRYRKMRKELPAMRQQFAALRSEWFYTHSRATRRHLVDTMTHLTCEAIRAETGTHRDFWSVYEEVAECLIAWEAKAF